jgi:hypothetical protein
VFFHGDNTGSNPVGDANKNKRLKSKNPLPQQSLVTILVTIAPDYVLLAEIREAGRARFRLWAASARCSGAKCAYRFVIRKS